MKLSVILFSLSATTFVFWMFIATSEIWHI
jgi:hypothetical protein